MAITVTRKIIHIDEDKCNGCGQCVTACAEGALAIIDGKARLVNEVFCDGLGACIGECPTGALVIEEREAPEFDPAAVERHLAHEGKQPTAHASAHANPGAEPQPLACGCPGSESKVLKRGQSAAGALAQPTGPARESQLGNWPVQLHLLPLQAPYYQGADLLLAADCVPFAHPDFHHDLLAGRTLAIGCPKLDDAIFYVEKLAQILTHNEIRSIKVAHMEVPCCFGLAQVAAQAVARCGKQIPVETVIIGRDGSTRSAGGGGCPHS